MIAHLKLTNFRRHRSAEFNFGSGLAAITGGNENGKSTIVEGMAYAIFGTRALRTPLADAVTWGEKESTLKVKAELDKLRSWADAKIRIRDRLKARK